MRMKRLKQKLEAEREKVSSYLTEIFPVCHRKQRHGIKAAVSGAVSDCLSLTHSTKTDLFRFFPLSLHFSGGGVGVQRLGDG